MRRQKVERWRGSEERGRCKEVLRERVGEVATYRGGREVHLEYHGAAHAATEDRISGGAHRTEMT